MRNLFIYPTVAPKMEQRTDLKRTSVHVKPRASLCTAICDLRNTVGGRFGAFALLAVRARNLGGLYEI